MKRINERMVKIRRENVRDVKKVKMEKEGEGKQEREGARERKKERKK